MAIPVTPPSILDVRLEFLNFSTHTGSASRILIMPGNTSMYASNSASQWGSPTAPGKLCSFMGFTGFFVVAPNLLGHAWRRGTDYRVSTLVEDLQPYFINDTTYDVVAGHSLGGIVALSLLQFLPKTKQATVILLDPPLEIEGTTEMYKSWFLNEVANVKTTEELVDDLGWSQRDYVLHALGVSMCNSTTIEGIFSVILQLWTWRMLLTLLPLL
ncbi:hypothetical protein DFJ58DRAFT_846982 [Suillus subalutaceus]|uniref:uncharacterized protein n=1 Tax=Suillus subalutaceus TaxID=48586 RepID=UPI001B87F276|nr:uncharacterized protein DFJ58DRAFT_846982 [Suillus subalutaceus]KAG1836406.1 hypothetical protein DFJ58DRAFT_846982 [Suillus subalutaceus]